jgi:hypothetical protein
MSILIVRDRMTRPWFLFLQHNPREFTVVPPFISRSCSLRGWPFLLSPVRARKSRDVQAPKAKRRASEEVRRFDIFRVVRFAYQAQKQRRPLFQWLWRHTQ